MRALFSIFCMAMFSVIVGCSTNSLKISNSVTLCCPGNYAQYRSYGIETVDMPLFLSSYVVEEFDKAFQEKGLTRNDNINDLHVTLTYRHVNLDPGQQNINPFIRQEDIDVELNYIATVLIDMTETATGKEVWSGKINRIHRVTPGEYMHEGRARIAFLETFRDLLTHYPSQE